MQIDNAVYLKHIRDSVYRIENYISHTIKNKFLSEENEMMRAAVVRELEVIGEAARNVTNEYKQRYVQIPWRDMMDTRNKIIHDYMSVDYELVWDIVKKDLPKLKKQIEKIVGMK